jgi:hypothetical protein
MEKRMQSLHSDMPLYELSCKLRDIEYTIGKHLNLREGIGREMMDDLISANDSVCEMNTELCDLLPHLEEIHGYYYASEQKDFEEFHQAAHESGKEPAEHIFYSLEILDDFIKLVRVNV